MSDLARILIEENLKTKEPVLDLGKCGLNGTENELYYPLAQANHIETLIFSNEWYEYEEEPSVWQSKTSQNTDSQNMLIQFPVALPRKLKTLVLAGDYKKDWEIQDFSLLSDITELQNLFLGYNQIQDFSFLEEMTQLRSLYLISNQIQEISFLVRLTQLKVLDIYRNNVQDISYLAELTQLKALVLGRNNIQDFSFLKGLVHLQTLYLNSINTIKDISFLENLIQLQSLDLSYNLIQDISPLAGLTQLKNLNLSDNEINNISSLTGLNQLQKLDLGRNHVQEISPLAGLAHLHSLTLGENQIQEISSIKALKQLRTLNVGENQILNFSSNFLSSISKIESLSLYGNPIQNIPKEIYDKRGNVLHDVRHYLEDLVKGATQNNEVKVILIGNGSVGKTQIANRLKEKGKYKFDAEHISTHAINLLQCHIKSDYIVEGLQLNLWDFGGQELYHATHRLFMQTRALFLLVWDLENENKEHHEWEGRKYRNENLRYWLEYATFFGNGSPILVVQNKVDTEEQEALGIPEPEKHKLKNNFTNISEFWQLSAKTGFNFDQLEYFIKEVFNKNTTLRQELIETKLPEAWVQVRDKVRSEQARENGLKQIKVYAFHAWCKEADVENSADTILQFFHDTGVLYYQARYFSGNIILNQAWAIEAIYKLLDRQGYYYKILQSRKGTLGYRETSDIWKENTDDERKLFIDFMISAELCFETTENKVWSTPFQDLTFVVPQLLREDKPNYIKEYEAGHDIVQVHEMHYIFLPSVFIQRFIVKAKDFAQVEDMWQSGVYLHYQGQYAVVEANYSEKKIIIRCNTSATELVKAIKEELSAINQNTSVKALPGVSDFMEKYLQQGFERLKSKCKLETPNHSPMKKEVKIFVSYSHEDRDLREILVDGLRKHLSRRENYTYNLWADDSIDLGANWLQEIEKAMEGSNAALLFVSASFASSDFINEEELATFFKKKKEAGFLIMPVLLRQYDFKHFEQLSALNFFKTYYSEHGSKNPIERNKLLPFDKLGDREETTNEQLNTYYFKLAGFIHTAVENHFNSNNKDV